MIRLRDLFARARRMTTGSDVGILQRRPGVMIDSRRIDNSIAFLPVPIWREVMHAFAPALLVYGGLGSTRWLFAKLSLIREPDSHYRHAHILTMTVFICAAVNGVVTKALSHAIFLSQYTAFALALKPLLFGWSFVESPDFLKNHLDAPHHSANLMEHNPRQSWTTLFCMFVRQTADLYFACCTALF